MIIKTRNENGEIIFIHEFIEPNIIFIKTFYYKEGDALSMTETVVKMLEDKLEKGDSFHFIKKPHDSFYENATYTQGDLKENAACLKVLKENWKQLSSIDIIAKTTVGYQMFAESIKESKNDYTKILNFKTKEEAFEYAHVLNKEHM